MVDVRMRERLARNAGDSEMTRRWDREWLHYLSTEDARAHFVRHDELGKPNDLSRTSAETMWDTEILRGGGPANLWMQGSALKDANVLEIGCGCGFLGKQVGVVAASYVGIDHSAFALAVARLTSPERSHYFHSADLDGLSQWIGRMDLLVGRHFFIHQNMISARGTLEVASALLRTGGLVHADFFLPTRALGPATVHHCSHDLDPDAPSAGYRYERRDIDELAASTGFEVVRVEDVEPVFRRFAVLRRK